MNHVINDAWCSHEATPCRSILETIGNTPVVRINRLGPPEVEIYAKLEAFNPLASVKDRAALAMIEAAERTGALQPGQTVIEATSGNTGISLAMACAAKGYPLVIVMAESFSLERRKLMRFLGARVVLTPASEKGSGMLKKARELAGAHGWFLCSQFDNSANAQIHYETTAKEILASFPGGTLDYWLSGLGTGGTLNGVARRLREDSPNTRIIACEPDNSPLLASKIKQERDHDGQPSASHPMFRPHLMQGWSPDFISSLSEDALADNLIDGFELIDSAEALKTARDLASREGILTGVTGGATMRGALQLAGRAAPGTRILVMLPDTGERYLSTPLFADIEDDMSPEEETISRSSPSCRFDIAPTSSTAQDNTSADIARGEAYIEQVFTKRSAPITVFGLAWCEYGWSAIRLLKALDCTHELVAIDSPALQVDNLAVDVRAALEARSSMRTFPQIYLGEKFIGGCTELFKAYETGSLQRELDELGIYFNRDIRVDTARLLPGWIQKRP